MRACLIAIALAAASATAHAQQATSGSSSTAGLRPRSQLRIAITTDPASSTGKALIQTGVDIAAKTQRRVVVFFYAGVAQADERDSVRKMGLRKLDGAELTAVGLSMIDESIRVLELPRLFDSIEEADYVAEKIWPYFQAKYQKKGYVLAARSEAGWFSFFAWDKIDSIAALQQAKLWEGDGDLIMHELYTQLSITGANLPMSVVDAALAKRKIDACYATPAGALLWQWSTKVRFETEMRISYNIRAVVLTASAFTALTPADAKSVATTMEQNASNLRLAVRNDNVDAERQLVKNGLTIVQAPTAMETTIQKAAQQVWKNLAGKVYSQQELDMVLKYRAEYRAQHTP